MPQFFLDPEALVSEDSFLLKGPEAHHIAKVMRLKEGDSVDLFDGRGGRYEGTLEKIYPDGTVAGTLRRVAPPHGAPKARLTLYQGLLKASRWEWLIEKGTELGIHEFVPVVTQRTVVQLREEKLDAKAERWSRIVMAAAKQCGRGELPRVLPPVPLREALVQAKTAGPILAAWERMAGTSAQDSLKTALGTSAGAVGLFVGPEGGFADDEIELARAHGASLFGLGGHTLRGETAGLAASAIILYELSAL